MIMCVYFAPLNWMFSSWQSKYRSVDAKNDFENTLNGIATDSDVAINWFKNDIQQLKWDIWDMQIIKRTQDAWCSRNGRERVNIWTLNHYYFEPITRKKIASFSRSKMNEVFRKLSRSSSRSSTEKGNNLTTETPVKTPETPSR